MNELIVEGKEKLKTVTLGGGGGGAAPAAAAAAAPAAGGEEKKVGWLSVGVGRRSGLSGLRSVGSHMISIPNPVRAEEGGEGGGG